MNVSFSRPPRASLPPLTECVPAPLFNSLSTGRIHPSQRVGAWVEAISRFAGAPVGAEAQGPSNAAITFDPIEGGGVGTIDCLTVRNWRLSKVTAGAGSLTFRPASSAGGPAPIMVALQHKGYSIFAQNGQEIRLGSGEIAVISVESPVRIVSEREVGQYLLWCMPQAQQGWHSKLAASSIHHASGRSSTQRLLRSFVEMLLAEPAMCTLRREEYLAQTLAWLLEQALDDSAMQALPPTDRASRLSRESIVRHIENNLHDPDLSPESIALALGCSRRTLHRAFDSRDGGGESLNRYVWRRRVERCADELRNAASSGRRQTVAQIAYSFGFSSCAHFSRLFKHHLGVTPLRFRQGL